MLGCRACGLLGAWLSLVVIQQREDGPLWLLWLFLLVWVPISVRILLVLSAGTNWRLSRSTKTWEGVLAAFR